MADISITTELAALNYNASNLLNKYDGALKGIVSLGDQKTAEIKALADAKEKELQETCGVIKDEARPLIFGVYAQFQRWSSDWEAGYAKSKEIFSDLIKIVRDGDRIPATLQFFNSIIQNGAFYYKEQITKYPDGSYYKRPERPYGIFYVKNTTEEDIISKFKFGTTSRYSDAGDYGGATIWQYYLDENGALVTKQLWNYESNISGVTVEVAATIPANTTCGFFCVGSSVYETNYDNTYHLLSQFMIYNMNTFMVEGIEFDVQTTLGHLQAQNPTDVVGILKKYGTYPVEQGE